MSTAPAVKLKMKSKIPKSEVVKFIIKEILRNQKISTQARLAELASQKLKMNDEGYRLSGRRARALAVHMPDINVQMETRHGPIPKRCPCCSHGLRKKHTKNLRGRRVIISLACSRCNYRGSENKWVPRRYVFEMIK